MAKCQLAKELYIRTPDQVGMLAEVTSAVAALKVNILGLCAYGMEGQAHFMMVTTDNAKVKAACTKKGWQVEESDVVIAEMKDEVGAGQKIADQLKAKNINLIYCYATTCACDPKQCAPCLCRLVLRAQDSKALLKALS